MRGLGVMRLGVGWWWEDQEWRNTMSHDLPDFHIPHAEKIEWMIETKGWAVEPVQPDAEFRQFAIEPVNRGRL